MQSGTTASPLRFAMSQAQNVAAGRPESLGVIGGKEPEAQELGFREVLDAINPLNHIPIVSDLFASATGHAPSSRSKLAGGALFGGAIGFVTSLASVIFEEATGATPVRAVVAALTGDAPATQLANAVPSVRPDPVALVAEAAPVDAVEEKPITVAALDVPEVKPAAGSKDSAVLELYGSSAASAHDSYRKAQMRSYLRDVTVSQVL